MTDALDLPYTLIDIDENGERFKFKFIGIDGKEPLSGKFASEYSGKGLSCDFECDITIGGVYAFFYALDTAYDIYSGINSSAVLNNYGDDSRTSLSFIFDDKGRCAVNGKFMNKENFYNSGINFSFSADSTAVSDIIVTMDGFFDKLEKINGSRNFY